MGAEGPSANSAEYFFRGRLLVAPNAAARAFLRPRHGGSFRHAFGHPFNPA
jgi:hypothetical protein